MLFILLGAFVLIAVLGAVAAQFFGNRNSGTEVETAKAEVRTITQVVTASGRVQPEVEIVISPDVSGEIIQLPVMLFVSFPLSVRNAEDLLHERGVDFCHESNWLRGN